MRKAKKRKELADGDEVEATSRQKKKKNNAGNPAPKLDEVVTSSVEISNVELMRMLRTSAPISSKLEQAYQYVECQKRDSASKGKEFAIVPMGHFISFLAEWIQPTIISSAKAQSKVEIFSTDVRSWIILHWCLSSATSVHIYPGILKGMEVVITSFGKETQEELLEIIVRILELLLQKFERNFRPQLLDWTSLVSSVLLTLLQSEVLSRTDFLHHRDKLLLKISYLIAEGFGKQLKTHANPKVAFQSVLEKLFDSLLSLMGWLGPQNDNGPAGYPELERLSKAVADVLKNALFHPAHLEGFSEVCITASRWFDDQRRQQPQATYTSYQRLLFEKLTQFQKKKRFLALGSFGDLLKIFIRRFKSHRASVNEDVFGVRGVGGQQEADIIEKQQKTGANEESKRIPLTDNQQQFLVFAEFTLPLIQELGKELHLSEARDSLAQLTERKALLAAVNDLFLVARDEHVYVPTRDTPSQGHLKFMKLFFNTLMDSAKLISTSWREAAVGEHKKEDSANVMAAVYKEIIRGMGYVLDMEHRVADDHTKDLWIILLSATAIEETTGVVLLGCQILGILSELRNLSSLPLLLSSARSLQSADTAGFMFLSRSRYQFAVNSFLCHPSFLNAIGRTFEAAPEAQAPEIVNMVSKDISEVLKLDDDTEGALLMAAAELHVHILQSLNVTSTNAFQVGTNVRHLVDYVVAEPLRDILDKAAKGKPGKRNRKSFARGTKLIFLLRLYLVCRVLHRQCVSLMPPPRAKKANAAVHEVDLNLLELDWVEVSLEPNFLDFFAWIGTRGTSVSEIVEGVTKASRYPAAHYIMDLMIIQRLNDLRRYIHSVEYFEAKFTASCVEDPVMHSLDEDASGAHGPGKHTNNLLSDLKMEANILADILLEGGRMYSFEDPQVNQKPWDGVVATLTEENISAARWQLISHSIDLWSSFAKKKRTMSVISYGLNTADRAFDEGDFSTRTSTHDLLSSLLFFETQAVQSVLLSAAWKALKEVLHLEINFKSFKKLLKNEKWMDSVIAYCPPRVDNLPSSKALEKCINLFQLISSFQWEHKSEQAATQYICCICYLERFLLNILVKVSTEDTKETEYVAKLLEAFAICRRTLKPVSAAFGLSVLEWLYDSIIIASQCLREVEDEKACKGNPVVLKTGRAFLASAFKSTQCVMQLSLKHSVKPEYFLRGESRAECTGTLEPAGLIATVLDFSIQQGRKLIESYNGEMKLETPLKLEVIYKQLGSVTSARTLLWNLVGSIEVVDKICQEDKARGLRWSTAFPKKWQVFLREVEIAVLTMLLGRVAQFEVSNITRNRILDIFLESTTEMDLPHEQAQEAEDSEDEEDARVQLVDESDFSSDDEQADSEVDVPVDDDPDIQVPITQGDGEWDARQHIQILDASQRAVLKRLFDSELEREESELVGELFMAMGALLKLRSFYFSPHALKSRSITKAAAPSSLSPLLSMLYLLLTQATARTYQSNQPVLFWLFGAVKCMESVGYLLHSVQPPLAPADYSKLLRMYVNLLAAILSSQSRAIESVQDMKEFKVDTAHFYSDIKVAVTDSFGALVKYAPRYHLSLALQTINEALCGGSHMSDFGAALEVGGCDGGTVPAVIAAGVECLAVSLDAVSGPWRLKILGKYSPDLAGNLLNLIAHLQGTTFSPHRSSATAVKSFPVVIQSLEILTKMASREIIFPMKAAHVALALHTPVDLLRPFYQHRIRVPEVTGDDNTVSSLYIACCKLLYAVLKHRKRQSSRNIALLGESIRVLLYCLESSGDNKNSSPMSLNSAIQCAHWLRRVFEELGGHKETLSRYCQNILSDYLSVLSGSGRFAAGLDRDIDKELRPGVYSLIGSSLDLQQLHAALGEGPLRNNLNMIRREYEKNVRYTGKV